MSIVKSPYRIKWGDNVIDDVEDLDFDFEQSSEDYNTLQGKIITADGPQRNAVVLTLLATDIPSLSIVLPQYFVPNGGILSTGETVNNADGAIDIAAAKCDEDIIFNNLDIESCGAVPDVLRLPHARTRIDDVEIATIRKVMVRFIVEAEQEEAVMQFFKKGTISIVS